MRGARFFKGVLDMREHQEAGQTMVHIWGPVISPTKIAHDDQLKRVVAARPIFDVDAAPRPDSEIRANPGNYLKGLIVRIRNCRRGLFKSSTRPG